jgi:protein Mpv17
VKQKLSDDYLTVVTANWTVWPLVQLINFRLIPPPLQMPVMNCVVFFWSAYLAVMGSKPQLPHAQQQQQIQHAIEPARAG